MVMEIFRVAHNLCLRKETALLAIYYLAKVNSKLIHSATKSKRDIIMVAAI